MPWEGYINLYSMCSVSRYILHIYIFLLSHWLSFRFYCDCIWILVLDMAFVVDGCMTLIVGRSSGRTLTRLFLFMNFAMDYGAGFDNDNYSLVLRLILTMQWLILLVLMRKLSTGTICQYVELSVTFTSELRMHFSINKSYMSEFKIGLLPKPRS